MVGGETHAAFVTHQYNLPTTDSESILREHGLGRIA